MTPSGATLAIDDDLEVLVNDDSSDIEVDLFNTRTFYKLHRAGTARSFYFMLRRRRSGAALGAVHFHETDDGHFLSPHRGSFGGFSLVRGADEPLATLERFVAAVASFLSTMGARRITVVLPPLAYHPHESSAWVNVLLRSGFSLTRHELSYAIEVAGAFVDRIDYGNRKQLKKCARAGLVCNLLPRAEYEDAYGIISESRRKKGRVPSMTWSALREMCDRMPERIRCFGVRRDGLLIAAAVCLVVNSGVLYVFYWGEIAGVETLSPVTFLAQHVYEHCVGEQIALLDLGTSTVDGIPNRGLIRYKKHLGCTESLKLTLSRVLT